MEVCISRLSSKGQLVLPKEAREESHAVAGDEFVVISEGERIELFKLTEEPKKMILKQLAALASVGEAIARSKGLKSEKQIVDLALKRRRE